MRPSLLAACFVMAAVAMATAQDLSADADKAMWCGAAFSVMQQAAADDAAKAKTLGRKADTAFSKAAAELITAGMSVEDFGKLAEDYAGKIVAPFRQGGFSSDACEALVGP